MAYWDIAQMSFDSDLLQRVMACAAQELSPDVDVSVWTSENILRVCAAPGWDQAWASAQAGGVPNPGRDPAVITDGQILASVQAVRDSLAAQDVRVGESP